MNKLENKSNNFLEMVQLVQNGVDIQWQDEVGIWRYPDYKKPEDLIVELLERKNLRWRKKPDAFQEWFQNKSELLYSQEDAAYAAWNAAIKHRGNHES